MSLSMVRIYKLRTIPNDAVLLKDRITGKKIHALTLRSNKVSNAPPIAQNISLDVRPARMMF